MTEEKAKFPDFDVERGCEQVYLDPVAVKVFQRPERVPVQLPLGLDDVFPRQGAAATFAFPSDVPWPQTNVYFDHFL